MNYKSYVPVWIKEPISVFLKETRKIPFRFVLSHVLYSLYYSRSSNKCKRTKKLQGRTYKYLEKKYKRFVLELTKKPVAGIKVDNSPIWVMWWQGECELPDIVNHCIKSIKRQSDNHPVIIIDSTNYRDFLDIPSHIMDKFSSGIISKTHFSDYFRVALLEKYGGLWIDASTFVRKKINEAYFDYPLFTIRNPEKDIMNISDWNWTVGLIGGWKGNILFVVVRKLLEMYWEEFDYIIDYYIFDYMIKICFENCNYIKAMIENIPSNNKEYYFLQRKANIKFDKNDVLNIRYDDTNFYRISWKGKYMLETKDGNDTLYSRWLEMCVRLELGQRE